MPARGVVPQGYGLGHTKAAARAMGARGVVPQGYGLGHTQASLRAPQTSQRGTLTLQG